MPQELDRPEILVLLENIFGIGSGTGGVGWAGYSSPMGFLNYKVGPESFPYRTETAEVVWRQARKLVPLHPEMDEKSILRKAVLDTGVRTTDMTPEDWRLLEMAIEWHKNGTTGIPKPRIGGMPGGPANHTTDGHHLAKRGAP